MKRTTLALLGVGHLLGAALLVPTESQAAYRRVSGGTSCSPARLLSVDYESLPGIGYQPAFVQSVAQTYSINGGTFELVDDPGGTGEIVNCNVPTDSYLPHHDMTEAHVSGYHAASNGNATRFRACSVWWTNGSWSCGGANYVSSSNFNEVITVSSQWDNWAEYPVISSSLGDGDQIYGIYFID
jgi:hypothetical protein